MLATCEHNIIIIKVLYISFKKETKWTKKLIFRNLKETQKAWNKFTKNI